MKAVETAINHIATAQDILWTPYGLNEEHVHKAFAEIFSHKVDFADLYFQHSLIEGWSLDEGIVKSGSFNIEQGVGVRAVSGEKTAFAYSDDIGLKPILQAAKSVREIAGVGKSVSKSLKTGKGLNAGAGLNLYGPLNPIPTLTSTEKVELLRRLEQFARKRDPRVIQVMANVVGAYDVVMVVRSDGHLAADIRPLVRVNVSVVVESKGQRETGSSGGGGRFGFAYFDDERLKHYADTAVDQALINLEARPAPAGAQTVVLGPGWPGVLLHEAVGHGLEGDFNRKGSSAFSGRIGERVAAKGVTVVDDGTLVNRRGSLNVDDEGNKTECTVLIEDGILKGYIQDMTNARLMKMPVTGNGRRESFAHLPMPRMTNTYMLGGDTPPEEIIASVKDGVYAVNFGGGQVDITSGKFVFSASLAYKIENGKVTYPVKGATLIGNGPDAMTKVSMIGNDMALDEGVGVCGKEGQSVPVGVGQPTLRIDGLVMGGTQ
ncbi:metalloprotease TldD [Limnobacter litoralis]|uniref:Peptidase C69 n=2 Tax=Limnobacter TaxID=131079 RepID=A0ABQ5YPV0_9BURK|nr:metalloprotease TldD [Limnobacter litoralis]GLR26129.1 peptidase C69 [Limnobacter litoralis]